MRPKYIIVSVISLSVLLWLHFFVVSYMAVATISKKNLIEEIYDHPKGRVFGIVSSSQHKAMTTINKVRMEEWRRVESYSTGWAAVLEWWPFALATALISGMAGWLLGKSFALDIYKKAADRHILDNDYKLEKAGKKLVQSQRNNEEAQGARLDAENFRNTAENMIDTAAAQLMEADNRTAEAERKLGNEREEHDKELKKARARIVDMKAKPTKTKTLTKHKKCLE